MFIGAIYSPLLLLLWLLLFVAFADVFFVFCCCCVDCKIASLEQRLREREGTIADLSRKVQQATDSMHIHEDKAGEIALLKLDVGS